MIFAQSVAGQRNDANGLVESSRCQTTAVTVPGNRVDFGAVSRVVLAFRVLLESRLQPFHFGVQSSVEHHGGSLLASLFIGKSENKTSLMHMLHTLNFQRD